MSEPLIYEAGAELAGLLRRYYGGEAALWGQIQALLAAELRARGLAAAPRHVRFRRRGDGYQVIVEDAELFGPA